MAVTQAQVAQLYVALFNRAAEGEGLRNWMADGANKTVAQLADSMLQAPAVRTYFNGSIDNDKDYIETIYKNILGKDYSQDPNGIDSWVKHLQAGHTRGETLVKLFEVAQSDIARAADPVAAQTFANKTAISEYVSQRIGNVSQDEEGNYNYTLFKQIISDTNATNLAHQKRLVDDAVKTNFTTNDDNLVGNSSDNIYETVVSGFMGTNTFQPNDKLDAGRGNDTLKVSLDTNFTGLTTGYVKNVENLELTNTSNAVRYFNMNNIENIKNIVMIGNYATRLTNESNIATLTASDVKQGEIAIVYNPATVSGSNDTQELFLENVGTKDQKVGVNFSGIENLNITTKTQASFISGVDNKNVNITGAVSLDVETSQNVESIDASTFAGNLTADVTASTAIKTIKGGSGKDTFKFASVAGANPNLTIDGGANEDSVEFTNLNGSRRLNANNVENVTFVKNNDGTLDLANAQSVKSVTVARDSNYVSATNSAIDTLNVDTNKGEAFTMNITTPSLRSINYTNFNPDEYHDLNQGAGTTRAIVANEATAVALKIDAHSNVHHIGTDGPPDPRGASEYLEASKMKSIDMKIDKSADTNKYKAISYWLKDAVSLETINYVNENDEDSFTIKVKTMNSDKSNDFDKLHTLNVKTSNSFGIFETYLVDPKRIALKSISEINLEGAIQNDGTSNSDIVLGELGSASSLHGVNLIARNLNELSTFNVITNTQVNARFNLNLENIQGNVAIGEQDSIENPTPLIKSGNTVVMAKNLQKNFTFANLDADTIATNSTDNVRLVFDKVKGDVKFGTIKNLSSLDGDFRNIDKTLVIGHMINSKSNSAVSLNLENIKENVSLGGIKSSRLDIKAKNLDKDFMVTGVFDLMGATNSVAHDANFSFDGIKGSVRIGDIFNFNNVKFDAKNVDGSFDLDTFDNVADDATVTYNFKNMNGNVNAGDVNYGSNNAVGLKYSLTADNLAQRLQIGTIGIKESSPTDIHEGSVNIDSGRTEGTVTIRDVTTGADSTVKIDLSQTLQANNVGNITGGNVTFKSSAISHTNGSSSVNITLASTTGINVDPKANVTGSVGQDKFEFNFRAVSSEFAGETYAVGGDLGDGMDEYTLNATVRADSLKKIDMSALKNVENGTINLGSALLGANNKSLTVKGTDGDDVFNLTGVLASGTGRKPNVLTLDGGNGVNTYNIGSSSKSVLDSSGNVVKYVSVVNVKDGDKITLGAAITDNEIKKVSAYLDNETSLKNAVNKVLNAADVSATANTTYAFMYKNDTYLIQDANGAQDDITVNDSLIKLAGYHIDNLNPYVSGTEITI